MTRAQRLILCVVLALLTTHCRLIGTPGSIERDAVTTAEDAEDEVERERRANWEQPSRLADAGLKREDRIRGELEGQEEALKRLTLQRALILVTAYNRDFGDQRDTNLAAALDYLSARRLFDPRLSAGVELLTTYGRDEIFDTRSLVQGLSATAAVDYQTEWGTQLRAELSAGVEHDGEDGGASSSVSRGSVSVIQPLLRGAGSLVNREPLTQAERNMIYQLRSFELFRQDLTINTIGRYFDLVRQKEVISNTEQRLDQADFLFRRAGALFNIGRVSELDVFQAEQQRLQAANDLRDARASYQDALIDFKRFLGVPTDIDLDVPARLDPVFREVRMRGPRAIELARDNRLDFSTLKDQLVDAERGVAIAENGLLPDLDLSLSATTGRRGGASWGSQKRGDSAVTAGLRFGLPLDRYNESVSLKRRELNVNFSRRALSQFRDQLAVDVRRRLRNLNRIEQSLAVQRKIVKAATKRLRVAQIRFRQGDPRTNSRDVVEAQQDLLDNQNRAIRFRTDYVVEELRFRRDIGILVIDPRGYPQSPNGVALPLLAVNADRPLIKPAAPKGEPR